MTDRSREEALAQVVEEAKVSLVPREVDWSAAWAGLAERALREARTDVAAREAGGGERTVSRRWGAYGAAALVAAAAAVALLVTRAPEDASPSAPPVAAAERTAASALVSTTGQGAVRIGGEAAGAGHVLRAGDEIQALQARALFEREGKVTWLLEGRDGGGGEGRARVTAATDSLVLALEDGAIEAQVTPVPSGEAFAIDVATDRGTVRVAVHGTHLRVSRSGTRVVVDLTEGVVAIGPPPSSGLTRGTRITAPAHVELDARDVQGTLAIDRAPAALRAAIPLNAAALVARAEAAERPSADPPEKNAPPSSSGPPHGPRTAARAPREAVARAVRECAAAQRKGADVKVTVSSELRLHTDGGGKITRAQFDPPLRPDIQSCAAEAIYKLTLEETGTLTVPIQFSY
jgi:hypothetical protein